LSEADVVRPHLVARIVAAYARAEY